MSPSTNPPFADCRSEISDFKPQDSGGASRTLYIAAICNLQSAICNRRVLALLGYPLILLVAFRWAHSTGEFLVLGLGPALLLDRYLLRLLPWTYPLRWTKELILRGAYVGLGGVGYSLVRAGMIRAEEAFSLGLALSLAAFLFECFVGLGTRGGKQVVRWWGGAIVRSPWSVVRRKSYGLRTTDYGLGILHHLVFFCPVVVLSLPFFALHMPRTVPAKTPAALHLPFEEIRFRTQDGLELAGWLVPHEHAAR